MFFNYSSDFSKTNEPYPENAHKVGIGEGVLLKNDELHEYVVTCGLQTCVAFTLLSPADGMVLLVHFYSIAQVYNDLKRMCDAFLNQRLSSNELIYCGIVGGRLGFPQSEDMVHEIHNFVREYLLLRVSVLKVFFKAPIVAEDQEKFSLLIHISSGNYKILNDEAFSSRDSSPTTTIASEDDDENETDQNIAFQPILFSNLIL